MDLRGRKIYRTVKDKRIAGVCGGLGEYFEIDPVFVRLVWVAGTCVTGVAPGILSYLIAWLIVPERPLPVPATQPQQEPSPQG